MSNKEILLKFVAKFKSASSDNNDNEIYLRKLWRAYNNAHPDFVKSDRFKQLLLSREDAIQKAPYFILKLIVDELKANEIPKFARKLKNNQSASERNEINESSTSDNKTPNREVLKKIEHLNKLNKTLEILSKEIKKLDETEIGSSDDEDNAYIKVGRYKARFKKVYKKICELKGSDYIGLASGKIKFQGTKYPELNTAIERFYNANRVFPDYRDIVQAVEKFNENEKLNLSQDRIHKTARIAFNSLGNQLQKHREYDFHDLIDYYVSNNTEDPAIVDNELLKKLNENEEHARKEEDILNEFVARQEQAEKSSNKNDDEEEEEEEEDDDDSEDDDDYDDDENDIHITISDDDALSSISKKDNDQYGKTTNDQRNENGKKYTNNADEQENPNDSSNNDIPKKEKRKRSHDSSKPAETVDSDALPIEKIRKPSNDLSALSSISEEDNDDQYEETSSDQQNENSKKYTNSADVQENPDDSSNNDIPKKEKRKRSHDSSKPAETVDSDALPIAKIRKSSNDLSSSGKKCDEDMTAVVRSNNGTDVDSNIDEKFKRDLNNKRENDPPDLSGEQLLLLSKYKIKEFTIKLSRDVVDKRTDNNSIKVSLVDSHKSVTQKVNDTNIDKRKVECNTEPSELNALMIPDRSTITIDDDSSDSDVAICSPDESAATIKKHAGSTNTVTTTRSTDNKDTDNNIVVIRSIRKHPSNMENVPDMNSIKSRFPDLSVSMSNSERRRTNYSSTATPNITRPSPAINSRSNNIDRTHNRRSTNVNLACQRRTQQRTVHHKVEQEICQNKNGDIIRRSTTTQVIRSVVETKTIPSTSCNVYNQLNRVRQSLATIKCRRLS